MKLFIGMHEVVSADDYIELALGTPLDLWLGVEGESELERAARRDAARDILADHPTLPDTAACIAAEAIDAHAPELFGVVPLTRPTVRRRNARGAVAA
ncbi:hypothetical protein [Streptomyces alboflavus]|uniref:hypothetical protein n=1 Tax=Streptomyces alboflavus TaxID=67267 RepID=UPI0036B6FCE2